ncbi:MAG: TIGR03936 family radical SAM-associated protein [Dehalococcoidia bacterium]|nr:TIGR03936 family radical SAM-associated protein [Dehalococcoidia bacterium]
MKVQRLRVKFSRGEAVKYVTHLDLMRLWERALLRAGIDLAYSEGFSPHARLSLAAPLAVGVTSSGELLDVFLNTRISPFEFMRRVSEQLPEGIEVHEARDVGLRVPSLQSEVRWGEYEVELDPSVETERARAAIERFLAAETLPWEHLREKETRRYDIRSLVQHLWLEKGGPSLRLGMRLRLDSGGSGRPEQVVAAMGLPEPLRIHRTKLVLAESSPAHEAWRRRGRFT